MMKNKIHIYFITRFFDWTPRDMEVYLKSITPNNDGVWKGYCVTSDLKKADCIVCWENIPEHFFEIHTEAQSKPVFWFPEEPGEIRDHTTYDQYLLTSPNVHFISPTTFPNVPGFFNLWCLYKKAGTYAYQQQLPPPTQEVTQIVAITSGDRNTEGQIQRIEFLKELCGKYPKLVHVYGRRWDGSQGPAGRRAHLKDLNGCYRGEIIGPPGPVSSWKGYEGKYGVYRRYRYALILENAQEQSWVTEKIVDAMLSWCYPFYWGCPNISDFLPKDSFYQIDILDSSCIEEVNYKSWSTPSQHQMEALAEARSLLMTKYHPLEIITSGIDSVRQKEAI
jgi:hypothetical protein